MASRVHLCLGLLLTAGTALATFPPPGLVQWGRESYTLDQGESVIFQVDFDQIPVRRWTLLVEGDTRRAHLNVRRARDGRLVYDQRGESRHEVEIPWGTGESISCVLTATHERGPYTVSIWGPPQDAYLRSYGYEVNRALEALAREERDDASRHLQQAMRDDPEDPVAATLWQALTQGADLPTTTGPGPESGVVGDPATVRRVEEMRTHAEQLRREGLAYAALDTLQRTLEQPMGAELLAHVYADLVLIHVDLGNAVQAAEALAAAEALGLPADEIAALRRRLDPAGD